MGWMVAWGFGQGYARCCTMRACCSVCGLSHIAMRWWRWAAKGFCCPGSSGCAWEWPRLVQCITACRQLCVHPTNKELAILRCGLLVYVMCGICAMGRSAYV